MIPPVAPSIPASIVRENIARLQDLLRSEDFAAVIVFDAPNMLAFTGTPHSSWDRLTCGAVVRDGGVHLVCPAFERPGVAGAEPHATIHTWREEENPCDVLATAMRAAGLGKGRVAVDSRTWLGVYHAFRDALAPAELTPEDHLLREVRICKSPAAQALLRAAHRKGERLFLELQQLIRPGVSERDLATALQERLNDDEFRVIPMIQSGPNGAIPHNPTGARIVQEGDNVVVDSVTTTDGFTNDLTRTYAVGEPSKRAREAYEAVRAAQQAAIAKVAPGIECREIDRAAREVIDQAGFGEFFTHRVGHGMGIECHEPPYLNGGNTEKLRPGMCFTIEPGVYVPGEFGVRIEDDVLVTEAGCEVIRGDLPTDVSPAFALSA